MSVKVMAQVWGNEAITDPGELLVLLALADWSNDQGHCWPKVRDLATKARMTRRNAQLVLRKLEADGYVARTPGTGRGNPNIYTVHSEKGRNLQHVKGEIMTPITEKGRNLQHVKGEICDIPPSHSPLYGEPSGNHHSITSELEHVHSEAVAIPVQNSAAPLLKTLKKPTPIDPEEFPDLEQLILDYGLPLDQLNDNDWWRNVWTLCNNPTMRWVQRELAGMENWLKENPRKRPTTGYKRFVRGWLTRAYERARRTNGT